MPDEQALDRALLADLSLARGQLHRLDAQRSDDGWLTEQWTSSSTRVLFVHDGQVPVRAESSTPRLATVTPSEVSDLSAERVLLGVDDDERAWFMLRAGAAAATTLPADATWRGLREIGADLTDDEAAVTVAAIALDNWHAAHPRCPRCGAPTEIVHAGWIRRCPVDGSDHYPRTDPAVIVLVRDDDDRALLGRQGRWAPGWMSTLAGFVEPGESAEAAVRREIAEESGVRIGEVMYLGSQPWPFPCSLMLGYHAWATTTQIEVDGAEIVEARWFTRAELGAACASGEVSLPPQVSIARKLIERWWGGSIPGDWSRR